MARIAAVLSVVFRAETQQLKQGVAEADRIVKKAGDGVVGNNDRIIKSNDAVKTAGIIGFGLLAAQVARSTLNIGSDMVRMGMQTEDGLNVFREVANASAEDMKRVQRQAIDLGRDMSLPGQSAANATQAMLELAKAGLDVDTTIGAARGTMLLAAAANVDAGKAAEINANALNAFNLPGTEAIRVADLLAGAANASSGEITDMALALQMSSAVFSAAGVPIEDLSTSIALMANRGIIGSDAGTSLKSMLLTLQTPSKKAKEMMDDLGLSLYDSSGNMKSMREIIANLQTSMAGLTQEQRETALGTIFGSDAIRSANVLLAEGVEGFDAMSVKVNEAGAAQSIAAARTEGLKGAFGAVSKVIQTQMLVAYLALAPAITKVVKGFAEFLPKAFEAMGSAWDAVGQPAMDAIKAGIDWLKENPEIAKGVLITLAGVLGGVFVGAVLLAASAVWMLVAPMLAALLPFILIGAAIGALIAILIYSYNHFEGFREVVDKSLQIARESFDKLIEVTKKLADWWKEMWPGMKDRIQKMWDDTKPVLQKLQDMFESVFGAIEEIVKATIDIISDSWKFFNDNLLDDAKNVWQNIVDLVAGAVESITEIIGGLADIISGIFDFIKAILTGKWGDAWDAVVKILRGAWDTIVGVVRLAIDVVVAVVKTLWEAITVIFEGAKAVVVAIWETCWGAIKAVVEGIVGAIKAVIEGFWEGVKGVFNAGKDAIWTIWDSTWRGVSEVASGIWTRIKNALGNFKDNVTGFFRDAWDAVSNFVKDSLNNHVTFVSEMPGKIKKAATGMWDGLKEAFKGALNWIIDGWNKLEFKIPGFEVGPVKYGGFTLGVPDVPRLETGAFVRMPTLAVIGDSAGGEWAVPERKADAFALARIRARGLDNGGGSTFNVTVNGMFGEPITERGLARKFVELEAMVNG